MARKRRLNRARQLRAAPLNAQANQNAPVGPLAAKARKRGGAAWQQGGLTSLVRDERQPGVVSDAPPRFSQLPVQPPQVAPPSQSGVKLGPSFQQGTQTWGGAGNFGGYWGPGAATPQGPVNTAPPPSVGPPQAVGPYPDAPQPIAVGPTPDQGPGWQRHPDAVRPEDQAGYGKGWFAPDPGRPGVWVDKWGFEWQEGSTVAKHPDGRAFLMHPSGQRMAGAGLQAYTDERATELAQQNDMTLPQFQQAYQPTWDGTQWVMPQGMQQAPVAPTPTAPVPVAPAPAPAPAPPPVHGGPQQPAERPIAQPGQPPPTTFAPQPGGVPFLVKPQQGATHSGGVSVTGPQPQPWPPAPQAPPQAPPVTQSPPVNDAINAPTLGLPLSPEYEAGIKFLDDQLAAELAGIGAAREELPLMLDFIKSRLATDEAMSLRAVREAMSERGVLNSSITTRNLGEASLGFDRSRQDLGQDVARQLRELSTRESAARMGHQRGMAELLMELARSQAQDPRAAVPQESKPPKKKPPKKGGKKKNRPKKWKGN